jgi:hypothetical protein
MDITLEMDTEEADKGGVVTAVKINLAELVLIAV